MGYDADGFYTYEESDLTDDGDGFSGLLNKGTDALKTAVPAMVHGRVVAELNSDPTIRAATIAAVTDVIDEQGVVYGGTEGTGLDESDAVAGFIGENGRETDLVVDEAGAVPDRVIEEWSRRQRAAGLYLDSGWSTPYAGFIGDNGRVTELVVDEHGDVPAEVLERWSARQASTITPDRTGVVDRLVKGPRNQFGRDAFGNVRRLVSDASVVVCMGDSLSDYWGRSQMTEAQSWPAVLDTLIPGTTIRGGVAGQTTDEIALRQGGQVLTVTVTGGAIPAAGAVAVTALQTLGWSGTYDFDGSLGGVVGKLRSTAGALTFTRTAPGDPVPAPGPVTFVPPLLQHLDKVAIFYPGRNDVFSVDAVSRIVSGVELMIGSLTPLRPRFLIAGPLNATTERAGSAAYNRVIETNKTLAVLHPHEYVDLRSYIVHEVIYELGITPTATDIACMAGDAPPPSIMQPADTIHYTAAAHDRIAHRFHAELTQRGWL
jgi:hypothetical protein